MSVFFLTILLGAGAVSVLLYFLVRASDGALPPPERRDPLYAATANRPAGRFQNFESLEHRLWKTPRIFRLIARLLAGVPKGPGFSFPQRPLTRSDFTATPGELKLYWLGHSMLILEVDGVRILTDPVFGNAGPLPRIAPRFQAAPLKRENLPPLDLAILSHDHYDHLEKSTVQFLSRRNIPILTPSGVGERLRQWGVQKKLIRELNWNDAIRIKEVEISARTTRHFSGRGLNDRDRTLWSAFVIAGPKHKIYFAGDGGYGKHFKEIGERDGPFDVTLLEIGSWSENWANSHLFPEETVQAHLDLRGKLLLPIHWGVFDLAFHKWDEPVERLLRAAEKAHIRLATPQMGEPVEPQKLPVNANWWRKPADQP